MHIFVGWKGEKHFLPLGIKAKKAKLTRVIKTGQDYSIKVILQMKVIFPAPE